MNIVNQIAQDLKILQSKANQALLVGDEGTARECLRIGAEIVQNSKKYLPLIESYRSLIDNNISMFENLIKIYLDGGKIHLALEILEVTKTWSMIEDYSKFIQINGTGDRISNHLREQLHQLRTLRIQLWQLSLFSDQQANTGIIEGALQEHNLLIDKMCDQYPEFVHITKERPPLRGLQNLIKRGIKVVVYGVFTDFCLIAAASDNTDGILWWKLDFGEVELGDKVEKLRVNISKWWSDKDEHIKYSKDISNDLIRPWFDVLGPGGSLCIIPHKSLHLLPFSALYLDGYLVEHFQINYSPSFYTLLREKNEFQLQQDNFLAFCNPKTTNDKNALPNTEIEAKTIASLYDTSKIFCNEKATVENFMKEAPYYNTIHLACHAKYSSDNPLASQLVLADDNENPSALHAAKILDIPIRSSLVTLSACETAIGEITNCDEIVGLSLSFLWAGAGTVLSSLWRAHDKSTLVLMEYFYKNIKKGHSYPQALCLAQREIINNLEEFKHPYFWAAFILFGFSRGNLQIEESYSAES